MKKSEIKTRIKDIFTKILPELKGTRFDFSRKQGDVAAWDSFAHMQIASTIERSFDIELSMKDIIEADSPARFVALIEKKL